MGGLRLVAFVVVASIVSTVVTGKVAAQPAPDHNGETWEGPRPEDMPDPPGRKGRSFDWSGRGDRRDHMFADRDFCRDYPGGRYLECDRPRRPRRGADYGGYGGGNQWRDFDPRDSRWGRYGGRDGGWHGRRSPRTHDFELRDYGGGDIDGPPRGLGLPYWAPD